MDVGHNNKDCEPPSSRIKAEAEAKVNFKTDTEEDKTPKIEAEAKAADVQTVHRERPASVRCSLGRHGPRLGDPKKFTKNIKIIV